MVRRSTLILLGVFIILVIGAVVLDRTKISLVQPTPTPTSEPAVFGAWPVQNTIRIELQSAQNQSLILQKDQKGQWALAALEGGQLSQGKIEEVLTSLSSAKVLAFPEISGGLAAVGLTKPINTLTLTGPDGSKHVLMIGNATQTASGYYAVLDADSKIMILEKTTIDDLLNNLKLEQLVVTPTPEPIPTTVVTAPPVPTPTK